MDAEGLEEILFLVEVAPGNEDGVIPTWLLHEVLQHSGITTDVIQERDTFHSLLRQEMLFEKLCLHLEQFVCPFVYFLRRRTSVLY